MIMKDARIEKLANILLTYSVNMQKDGRFVLKELECLNPENLV